jgi:hypothetical protein
MLPVHLLSQCPPDALCEHQQLNLAAERLLLLFAALSIVICIFLLSGFLLG